MFCIGEIVSVAQRLVYEGGESVEDIAYNFSIPLDSVRELLTYAAPVASEGFMDGIDDPPVQEREPYSREDQRARPPNGSIK
jgi:hypothetical protein